MQASGLGAHWRQTIKSGSSRERLHAQCCAIKKQSWLLLDGGGFACSEPPAVMRCVNLSPGLLCFAGGLWSSIETQDDQMKQVFTVSLVSYSNIRAAALSAAWCHIDKKCQ